MNDFIRENKIFLTVLSEPFQTEHFHQDVELLYILDGELTLQIYEKKILLGPEDIIIINANERHSYEASGDIILASVNIAYHLISRAYNGISSRFICNSASGDGQNYEELRRVLGKLLMNYMSLEQGVEVNYEYLSAYFHLLELLKVHFLMYTTREKLGSRHKNEQRMQQIHDYIEGNYAQPLTFHSLAEHLYLSEGYLSRYFKQTFNMKFTDYLKQVRLSHAMEALMYTDRPVTKIAYDCGFPNVSLFNKLFKAEYGKTPTSVRGQGHGAAETLTGERISDDLTRRLDFILSENRAKNSEGLRLLKGTHTYSVKTCEKVDHNWNKVINIGSAADILRSEIQEHIILLSQALKFKYIRFWSIFSKEMLIDIHSKNGEYNFAKLDQVLDFLVGRGLKPFIDLEEKPRRINANTDIAILYEDKGVMFLQKAQCEALMETFFRHLVKRYGVEELETWKIEVWYGGYSIAGRDAVNSYFEILKCVQLIARKYVPPMAVGGSGIFPDFMIEPQHREINFWEVWKQQALPPDFISVMNYAYENSAVIKDHFGKRSTDVSYLLHSIRQLRRELNNAGFTQVPIYITEWNLTVSDRNYVNDSCFQGAYIVKNVIDTYREADMLAYFTGSDRTSEYYDSGQLLHGGQGLLTKDGIFKPAAFAVDFLNHVYGYYIGHSDHFLITGDLRGNYGVICHNMKSLSSYYYLSSEDQIEKDKVWRCFEDRDGVELELCLTDVADGNYQIKIHRINEKSGSVLDVWKELGYYPELSRDDVKYFRRICEPRLTIGRICVEGQSLAFKLRMESNEIAFIEIHIEM